MLEGDVFPPVIVFLSGNSYFLVDGYLRFEAAKLAGSPTMRCEIHRGDLRQAILFSVSVNALHGERRTGNDRRRAIGKLLADPEWSQWSNREIGRRCHASHGLVAQLRDQLRSVTGKKSSDERRYVNKHGNIATMKIAAFQRKGDIEPQRGSIALMPVSAEPAQVVSLSSHSQDYRSTFVAELRIAEEAIARLPSHRMIRSDAAADKVLALRLKAVAEKAILIAKQLEASSPSTLTAAT